MRIKITIGHTIYTVNKLKRQKLIQNTSTLLHIYTIESTKINANQNGAGGGVGAVGREKNSCGNYGYYNI